MSRKSEKARIILNEEQRKRFEKIVQSRSAPIREVQRARILLSYSEGESITGIEEIAHVSRPTIYKCIGKALALGLEAG